MAKQSYKLSARHAWWWPIYFHSYVAVVWFMAPFGWVPDVKKFEDMAKRSLRIRIVVDGEGADD